MSYSPQPPFPSTMDAVIFDVDGTMAASNQLIFASFNHVADRYLGKQLSDREIISLFGPPEEGGLKRLLGTHRAGQAMDDLCSYYDRNHDSSVSLHAGIDSMLRFLRAKGTRLAVFTGKGERTTAITLGRLGISSFFDKIVTGSDVRFHKPHPEGIRTIVDEFRIDPGNVLMVGDSVSDIRAARDAGVCVAAVLWDAYDPDAVIREGADRTFRTVAEMQEWLETCSWSRTGNGDG